MVDDFGGRFLSSVGFELLDPLLLQLYFQTDEMFLKSLLLLVLAATVWAESRYFGNSCNVIYGNVIVDGVQQQPEVSGSFQLQGYCGLKDMVTIPCTAENSQCQPTDCECFGLAGNGGGSFTGAAATAGVALVALLV